MSQQVQEQTSEQTSELGYSDVSVCPWFTAPASNSCHMINWGFGADENVPNK